MRFFGASNAPSMRTLVLSGVLLLAASVPAAVSGMPDTVFIPIVKKHNKGSHLTRLQLAGAAKSLKKARYPTPSFLYSYAKLNNPANPL